MSPLLTVWLLPFEEALDWLQCKYTAEQKGDYVLPASTVLVHSVVLEGDTLFLLIWRHLIWGYPIACASLLPHTSMIGTAVPDYYDYSPIGRSPECREVDPCEGGKL